MLFPARPPPPLLSKALGKTHRWGSMLPSKPHPSKALAKPHPSKMLAKPGR
jgi:hypothetical protein